MALDTNSKSNKQPRFRQNMNGVFFRRTLLICFVVLLLANLLLLAAYSYFGRRTYISLEMDGLDAVVTSAQDLYELRDSYFVNKSFFADTLAMLTNTADVRFYYFYYDEGNVAAITNIEQYNNEYIQSVQYEILSGKTVHNDHLKLTREVAAISVGSPLYNTQGDLEAGIIIVRDIQHIEHAFDRLNSALWIMAGCVLPLMLLVSYVAAHNATKPITEMTSVAIELSKGNYGVHANENLSGEFGIFARAMNRLSDALSQTIHQLDSEKHQLWYILSSFSDGVAALDNLGNLTHYNPALMRMFGAIEVKYPIDLVPDKKIWDAFQSVLDTKDPQTLHYELPGEKSLWISIVPVMTESGACTGVVGLFKDATEMENLERMRRDYVANISHELRTPLTAVRGLLEPLSDGLVTDDDTRMRYYSVMLHEVERLSRLITDMLQLSRLQAGTEYMELRTFDIGELLHDVLQGYSNTAHQKNIDLQLVTDALPPVISDPDRIEQVMVILLDNAMRYAGEKEDGVVRIETRQDSLDVYVSVWDNGCGISPEDIQHVFERFYKASKARNEGGTGLGLSIAKQIVDKLGESISVNSKLGEWTCFTFTINKYVSNAIPLGPVDSNAIIMRDMSDEGAVDRRPTISTENESSFDAPYEVIADDNASARKDHRRKK